MWEKTIVEAIEMLKDNGPLLMSLVSIIEGLEREQFMLLVENIVIKKHGHIASRTSSFHYNEYRTNASDLYRHRAYLMLDASDYGEIVALAKEDPYVGESYIYAQGGFEPDADELQNINKQGINVSFSNVLGLAQDTLRYDLVRWIIAAVEDNGLIKTRMYGNPPNKPGIRDAMVFLVKQLDEEGFSQVVHESFIRQGFAGKQKTDARGSELIGVNQGDCPIYCRTKIKPSMEDFEDFYQNMLERRKSVPEHYGVFCHLTDLEPDFELREVECDPNSEFGMIVSLGAYEVVSLTNESSWLQRWLIQRFDAKSRF